MFFKNEGVVQVPVAQTTAEAILSGLESGKTKPGFTSRELGRRHVAGIPADAIPAALALLVEHGALERRTVSTGGRSRVEYHRTARITPAAYSPRAAAPAADPSDLIDAAHERDSALLAVAAAESRLRHQAADYERRIADLTRQAAAAETAAREAREMADRVLLAAMEAACFNARLLASRGVEVAS